MAKSRSKNHTAANRKSTSPLVPMRPSSKVMPVPLMKKMMGAADEVPLMAFENERIIVPPRGPNSANRM